MTENWNDRLSEEGHQCLRDARREFYRAVTKIWCERKDRATRQVEQELLDALSELSYEDRIVLILKDRDDLKYEEIGHILELPITAVRARLHRARQELRDVFKRTGNE